MKNKVLTVKQLIELLKELPSNAKVLCECCCDCCNESTKVSYYKTRNKVLIEVH